MIQIKHSQSLIDVGIQYGGAYEAAVELALLNGFSLSDDIEPGARLIPCKILNEKVSQRYNADKIIPATALSDADELLVGDGIGQMRIGINFVIS